MLIYLKSTIKLILLISVLVSCSVFDRKLENQDNSGSTFSKGQALITAHDYKHALPYLNRSLEEGNANYKESLLLAARAYDQLSEPEQAILSLQEFLKLKKDDSGSSLKDLTARSLLLKNQAKAKLEISQSDEKRALQNLVNDKSYARKTIVGSLAWSLDFNCDKYCVDEIRYFQEIQTLLLYIVEQDAESSAATAALIKDRYIFFHDHLNSDLFNQEFKRQIASNLYDCYQKLKTLDLVYTQRNKTYPSKVLIASLSGLAKDLESWLNK